MLFGVGGHFGEFSEINIRGNADGGGGERLVCDEGAREWEKHRSNGTKGTSAAGTRS